MVKSAVSTPNFMGITTEWRMDDIVLPCTLPALSLALVDGTARAVVAQAQTNNKGVQVESTVILITIKV